MGVETELMNYDQVLQFFSRVTGNVVLSAFVSIIVSGGITFFFQRKLEKYKEGLKHQYQIDQMRTSLFFDHQRAAFALLLSKIAEIHEEWLATISNNPDDGLVETVPRKPHQELRQLYQDHQLFLDDHCLLGMNLILHSYLEASSYDYENDIERFSQIPPEDRICSCASYHYDRATYIQARLADLFREKIGVSFQVTALRDLTILGAIEIVNRPYYSLNDDKLFILDNALKTPRNGRITDNITIAEKNIKALLSTLKKLVESLSREGICYSDYILAKQYLDILQQSSACENPALSVTT